MGVVFALTCPPRSQQDGFIRRVPDRSGTIAKPSIRRSDVACRFPTQGPSATVAHGRDKLRSRFLGAHFRRRPNFEVDRTPSCLPVDRCLWIWISTSIRRYLLPVQPSTDSGLQVKGTDGFAVHLPETP